MCVCVCVSEDYRVQANKCCPVYLPHNGGSGSLVDRVELLVWCVCVSEDYMVQANKRCAVYLP